MKLTIQFIGLILIVSQSTISAQFAIQLWNENLVHELKIEEEKIWTEKLECAKENDETSNCVKWLITPEGEEQLIARNEAGEEYIHAKIYFSDKKTQVSEINGGDKEVKKYNENGYLIEKTWVYSTGSEDLTSYEYEGEKLVKISEKDDYGLTWERLIYEGDNLVKIESYEGKKKKVMERHFIYNEQNQLVKQQRIQKKKTNKQTYYTYDEKGRLLKKEINAINRLTGNLMGPEDWTCTYYDNNQIKEERITEYYDEEKTEVKREFIELYLENGLLSKETIRDRHDGSEQETTYEYKLKE